MILGIILGIAISFGIYFALKNRLESDSKASFENLASKIFEEKINGFVNLSANILGEKKKEIKEELQDKEKKFEELIDQVRKELKHHQDNLTIIEKDRIKSFTELQKELGRQNEITNELKLSTNKLHQTLSNSKLRGQYGEKIAEDILRASNLIEGTHYIKNKKQETFTTRPDFTFLLPSGFKINMDVKFPLDNFIKFVNAENQENQEESGGFKKLFLKDLKDKIKEVTTRDYINPQENTLDYVMLFIPNENISSFIHENFPDIFDLAIKEKVALVSPYQLFGFVSIIRQAFQNFHYEERTKIILGLIGEFSKRFDLFKKRFVDVGDKIDKVKSVYEDIEDKSFKNINSIIKKIEQHKSGLSVEAIEESDNKEEVLEKIEPPRV